jgi:hypothetical protein
MIRIAAVVTVSFVVVACSSFPDQVPAPEEEKKEQNDIVPAGSTLPPASNPKSGTQSTDASSSSETSPVSDGGTTSDASSDAAAVKTDAGTTSKDAAAPVTKIAFGQPCTNHTQCADGLCLPFDGKGLRCTKACQDDSDCPSDDCDGDSVRICDVD